MRRLVLHGWLGDQTRRAFHRSRARTATATRPSSMDILHPCSVLSSVAMPCWPLRLSCVRCAAAAGAACDGMRCPRSGTTRRARAPAALSAALIHFHFHIGTEGAKSPGNRNPKCENSSLDARNNVNILTLNRVVTFILAHFAAERSSRKPQSFHDASHSCSYCGELLKGSFLHT
jgi:hypothetical protein